MADKNQHDHDEFGAIVTEDFSKLSLWQSMKKWKRVSIICIAMTTGIIMYGFDYAIVGSVASMPSFQMDYGEILPTGQLILPSVWLGIWTFVSPGAGMIGSMFGGWMQDRTGRRWSMAAGSALSVAGIGISFSSGFADSTMDRRVLFLVGKAVQGLAIGMVMTAIQTYMTEVMHPNLRGSFQAFFPFLTVFGQLIGICIIYATLKVERGYIIAFATQWPFSIIPLIISCVVPESPTYLIRRGLEEKAFAAQKKLDADGIPTETVLNAIRANIEHERELSKATFADCFKGINNRRTSIVIFMNLCPSLLGITILAKGSYLAQTIGFPPTASIVVQILGTFATMVCNLISMHLISVYSRRKILIPSMAVVSVLWLVMGISGIWHGIATAWIAGLTMCVVGCVLGLGAWPVCYAIAGETSNLQLRSKTLGIGWLINNGGLALFGFVMPFLFNPDQGNLGAKIGFIYCAFTIISIVGSFFWAPDMKGRTAAEIDMMFEERLPARKFRGWSDNSTLSMKPV